MLMPKTATEPENYKIDNPEAMKVDQILPLDVHPGVYLRDTILPAWGQTNVAALARALGVNRPNLVHVLAGRVDVSRELAYRLGARFNDAVADLLISYQLRWDMQNEASRREALSRN
jgi:plasmid maintenance system antidote protein VapI